MFIENGVDLVWFVFSVLPILATVLPLIRHSHWGFRIFDFPRLQIAVWNILALLVNVIWYGEHFIWLMLILCNLACLLYQLRFILVYTRLVRPEVRFCGSDDNENTISLITGNVLTPNRQVHLLLNLIEQYQPDVVLTLESDAWWEEQLRGLETHYTYTVKIPLDNLYGMHLYSRLPLRNVEIRHWVAEDIPSIAAQLQLRSGSWIDIYALHPMPPSPTEAPTSTDRDAELLLVSKEIARAQHSTLVFGDLNDVAWSQTSLLFQQISGLLDPRKGRGLFNTFHARFPLLRWPLDHIFHSSDFMVKDIRVLPFIGSDHFPVYGKFQFAPAVQVVQQKEQADHEDHQEAREKIAEADPIKQVVAEKYPD